MTQQLLLVDDDPVQRRLLEAQVARMGYRSISCEGGRAALDALRMAAPGRLPAAMVLDLSMPDMDGVAVMAEMRRAGLDVPVVVQTAKGSVDTAVEAMRAGAFDFVVKPVSPERLRATLEDAVRLSQARRRRARAERDASPAARLEAASEAMAPVIFQAKRAAASQIPILLEGETGVGKEWLAAAILAAGPRAAKPFVAVNCGALPAALAESILFGHAKGAFTDASERRPGKFLEADGGTLFLDEIGELPLDIQAKLLRVVQDGRIDPVGGQGGTQTDVRILSATNRDLEKDVAAGRFREDLYFRLNVLAIRVPPLRERREEIIPLARGFLAEFSASDRPGETLAFAADALHLLQNFDWPGNIRQLENAIHRAVVLAEGPELGAADFPQIVAQMPALPMPEAPRPIDTPLPDASEAAPPVRLLGEDGEIRSLEAIEADLIRFAILRYGGRLSEVARRLGIGRSTLYRKLQQYGLEDVSQT
ncbi:sigma-54-dependent Fis family transcriptional regulator [Aureimonas endophytica]|uniref:DNA-binding transcriptional regulator NtrC n=1 Tax=Aureimonas endophytica TaxID=2027858 RepID=A0A917E251_9HYPH|nr:sigma-54 dependent transcriptional regulator [Aureimonas endophytica]GGD95195.1 sigma-54-dependent Fis family transcriptional regulator [Aureimonas endophytica]